jgi:hypothetical protein
MDGKNFATPADMTDEAEITDAMVEAGGAVLSESAINLAQRFISPSVLAEMVYLAMARHRLVI